MHARRNVTRAHYKPVQRLFLPPRSPRTLLHRVNCKFGTYSRPLRNAFRFSSKTKEIGGTPRDGTGEGTFSLVPLLVVSRLVRARGRRCANVQGVVGTGQALLCSALLSAVALLLVLPFLSFLSHSLLSSLSLSLYTYIHVYSYISRGKNVPCVGSINQSFFVSPLWANRGRKT